jgi:hypothetical protein
VVVVVNASLSIKITFHTNPIDAQTEQGSTTIDSGDELSDRYHAWKTRSDNNQRESSDKEDKESKNPENAAEPPKKENKKNGLPDTLGSGEGRGSISGMEVFIGYSGQLCLAVQHWRIPGEEAIEKIHEM